MRQRAETKTEPVRLVVVEPASADLGTVAVLRQLGREIQIEVFHDAALAAGGLRKAVVDLVVVECSLAADLQELLREVDDELPPVVVVSHRHDEAAALAAFRRGAADCVTASGEYAEVLPVVALEQIRRARKRRERRETERLGRRVDALTIYNENIIQNMNSALLVVDSEGWVVRANPTAERILDVAPGSLRERSVLEWFPGVPRERVLIARTLREGARFRGAETTLTRADGAVIPIGMSSAPLLDENGQRVGAVAIFQDLTAIKQLQNQVLQAEKMASIGQLAAGVAHEINNPMGFIHANLCQMGEYLEDLQRVWERVEALRACLAARSREDRELDKAASELDRIVEEVDAAYLITDFGKAVRESLEGSDRIRHIVRDLRAFSHQDTAQRVETDLNKALDSTANMVWTMMKHQVTLTKHYAELPLVQAYPMQIKQVFMNLLVNAYQAIEERFGGEGGHGEIRLRSGLRNRGVFVSVSDNGIGIAPDAQERIFEPFFTTKEVGAGTGLGLSTSYNLVRRHGGRIAVESELGAGSTFEVWLPQEGSAVGEER